MYMYGRILNIALLMLLLLLVNGAERDPAAPARRQAQR